MRYLITKFFPAILILLTSIELFSFDAQETRVDSLIESSMTTLQGEPLKSLKLLNEIPILGKSKDLIYYKMALNYFLIEDYDKSLELLLKIDPYRSGKFDLFCPLLINVFISKGDLDRVEKNFYRCRDTNLGKTFFNGNFIQMLINLRSGDRDTIGGKYLSELSHKLNDIDEMKSWFKMGIFLNQQNILLDNLDKIPEAAYQSRTIRGLMASAYYRSNDNEKAKRFVKGVQTANSENMLGNLKLLDKKDELAWGHFNVAYKKVNSSFNAIKRLVPLAWKLERYEEGLKFINNIKNKNSLTDLLEIAYLFKNKKYTKGFSKLLKNYSETIRNPPLISLVLGMNFSLMTKNNREFKIYAYKACERGNKIACYLHMQHFYWKNFNDIIDGKRSESFQTNIDYKKLMSKNEDIPKIKETVIINQTEIDELDNAAAEKNLLKSF